jgi:hypothetical protein
VFITTVAGMFAGAIHVLSGPDHLAAIAPLASDGRRHHWKSGAVWGFGHSSGVLIVGLLALLFKDWLPVDVLSSWSELIVGFTLVAIGLWGLQRALRARVKTQAHDHDGLTHAHAHLHAPPHTHAAFGVGILHGFAGSSHFIAVLPALALPDLSSSLGYLAGYGAGTVAAMSLFSTAIGLISARAASSGPGAARWLLSGCSAFAMIVGIAWIAMA